MFKNFFDYLTEFSLKFKKLITLIALISTGVFLFSIITRWIFLTMLTGYIALGVALVSAGLALLAYFSESKQIDS